jgi:acetyl-CoA carboxylase biotin carboxyl carrier protein
MAARRNKTGKKKSAARKPAAKRPARQKQPAAKKTSKRVAEIQEIIDLMQQAGAVEIETDDGKGGRLRVRLKEDQPPTVVSATVAPQPVAVPVALVPAPAQPASPPPLEIEAALAPEPPANEEPLVSPMVGTFYRAASPEVEPFASVGDTVDEETTICIIEAMKVMNEIKAEMSGTIVEILVENGEPVEFGQPLFRVAKD